MYLYNAAHAASSVKLSYLTFYIYFSFITLRKQLNLVTIIIFDDFLYRFSFVPVG